MRTTFGLLALLIIIVASVLLLRNREGNSDQSFADYEGNFAVEDINQVYRVRLTRGDKKSFDFKRQSTGWTVNDHYPVRMSSMEPLLEVVEKVSIKYIPPQAAMEYIMWDIGANAIKVEVLDKDDQPIKVYHVAGSTNDERGTHMIMEGSTQPFVMHLPTMDGSFRSRFTLEIDDWRDRHFMTIQPRDIERVIVEYPRQKSQSFVLEAKGSDYSVKPLYPELRQYPSEERDGTTDMYLRALTGMACESYETGFTAKDSIRSLQPFSRIAIETRDTTRSLAMNLYPKGPLVQSEFSPAVHRFFIDIRGGDFIQAQYFVIEGMLRGYDFFFAGNDQALIF